MKNVKPWTIGIVAVAVLGGALTLGAAAGQSTLPPQTSVGGIDVSGLSQDDAVSKVQAQLSTPASVVVKAGEQSWTLDAAKLGYRTDAASSVAAAFKDAGGRNFVEKVQDLAGQRRGQDYPLSSSVDSAVTKKVLSDLTQSLNTAPKSGKIAFERTRYVVSVPDQLGKKVDIDSAVKTFAADPTAKELKLNINTWAAPYTAAKLQVQVDKGNALLRPLTVQLGDNKHTGVLSPLQVANLFWVRETGLELDTATLKAKLKDLSSYLDKPAQNARYKNVSGKLVRVKEESGYVTDQAAALSVLGEAVLDRSVTTVKLPSKAAAPTLTLAALPDPNKLSLIARGVSTYYHSSPERRTNVANAAEKIDGAVVPAGATFSFLNTLGSINSSNGFVGGLIISGGRTVDGLGGGVCQVSTTTFRALYQAGLPVVERNQHSYRVGYYEPKVGFEAAVYDPGVDLKMKNDTGGTILIRAINDNRRSRLVVEVWGTAQSRTVSVSDATILSRTPHPAAKYIVNPDLPRGATKQVDWAADGYNLFITRTIRDGGKVVSSDKVSTVYKPWQAVYEVGPG